MSQQLALKFTHIETATLDNFQSSESNTNIIPMLLQFLRNDNDPFFLLWGEPGSGKTHLLTATCSEYEKLGHSVAYLPMETVADLSPELLMGLEQYAMVCIDNIHCIAGNKEWETALFNLYNQLRNTGKKILVSSLSRPDKTAYVLPDLLSRLQWGMSFQLTPLVDEQKKQLVWELAQARSLPIDSNMIDYLFKHYDRNLTSLVSLLDILDKKSLQEKRKLTIPFISQIIAEQGKY